MSKIRKQISPNTPSTTETRNVAELKAKTGNIYESLAIISKRASQINVNIKEELQNRLEEFGTHTDTLEEVHENKEQIEISRMYEKMPNPTILAIQEFMEDKTYFRKQSKDELMR